MKTGPSGRTPACAWMTPLTTSPSLPAHSPYVVSCWASRSRLTMTCFAVIAAIRPKPLGVSSHSRISAPSSSSSCAQTRTSPVLRSSSTRACGSAASVCWYAASSALSMASTTVSNETSFSRTRLRSAVTSMFMGASPTRHSWGASPTRHSWARLLVRATRAGATELDLNLAGPEGVVRHRALRPVDVEGDARVVGSGDPAGHVLVVAHRGTDEPTSGAAPVPRLRQRPVDPGRGHLEGVGRVAGGGVCVEGLGDQPGDLGDGIEVDPAVAVDDDAQDTPPAGCRDGHVLQVVARVGHHGREDVAHPLPGDSRHDAHLPCSLVRASGRAAQSYRSGRSARLRAMIGEPRVTRRAVLLGAIAIPVAACRLKRRAVQR